MKKYSRGKFPYTVKEIETGKLYVRKSVSGGDGKQRQIWRTCQPQTARRVLEVLAEIEDEISTQKVKPVSKTGLQRQIQSE